MEAIYKCWVEGKGKWNGEGVCRLERNVFPPKLQDLM